MNPEKVNRNDVDQASCTNKLHALILIVIVDDAN